MDELIPLYYLVITWYKFIQHFCRHQFTLLVFECIVSSRVYSWKPRCQCWDYAEAKVWKLACSQSMGSYLNHKEGASDRGVAGKTCKQQWRSARLSMLQQPGSPSRLPRPLKRESMPLLNHVLPLNINEKVFSLERNWNCPDMPAERSGVSRRMCGERGHITSPMTKHSKLGQVSCSSLLLRSLLHEQQEDME